MNVDRFWYGNMTGSIPASWHYLTGGFSLLCLIVGFIANGLVIFVFLRNNALQRPRNYFLINLAVTDLGLLLTNNTMHSISSFRKKWIFGQAGCNFYSVCGGVFGLTSIATMAAISITRVAAVNDPFSSLKLTSGLTFACLALSWIYGSMWIMPPLFGWNRFILEGFGTSCTFDYVSKDRWDQAFIVLLITGGFLIPLLIIVISYTIILVKLSERGRRLTGQTVDATCSHSTPLATTFYFSQLQPPNDIQWRVSPSPTHDTGEDRTMSRNLRRTEMRATRTALLVCTVFCSAWGPYALVAFFSLFGFDHFVNAYSTAVLGVFTKVAACINPLVYALSLRGFRGQICAYVKYFYSCDQKQQRLFLANPELHRSPAPPSVEIRSRNRTYSNSNHRFQI